MKGVNVMPPGDDMRRQSAEERARALLARLDSQPPPDFQAQVLARIDALQARRAAQEATPARPLPSHRPSRGWCRVCCHLRRRFRLPGRSIMAGGLVVASAVLLWCVSTRTRPTALPEEARPGPTTLQYDTAPIGGYLHVS